MTEFISLDASIELSKWDSSINQMLSDAARIEKALNFGAVSIRVDIDDAALVDAVGLVDRLNAQNASIRVDALVDEEFRNAAELIDRIDSDKATVQIDALVDREFQSAQRLVDRLDSEKVKVKVEAEDNASSTLRDIEGKLENLQSLAAIQLTLDAAGFLQTFNSLPIVSTMLDVEAQTQRVVGSITRDLPNAGDIINEVYTNNWGASREEVASVVIALAQLKDETGEFILSADELGDAAQSAFAAAQLSGGELQETINAASALVRNELVDSYTEAFDFIAQGSREGLNQQGDLLDTINEYSSTFGSLGITAEGFFNILKTGTEAGAYNTDKIADSFKEMMNLTKEEVQIRVAVGDETDRTKALEEIGLFDEAQAYAAGELTGDQFGQGVLDALNAISDPAEQQRLAKAIFSPTMIEDAGLDNILATSLESEENKGAWEGAATEGANIINDTLGSALTEAVRTFETEMGDVLKTVLVDSGFLEQIENAAMTFADTIQGGGTMGEAIELSLGLEENSIARLESWGGNFIIELATIFAGVVDLLGGDSAGIRASIAGAAENQLEFDIQLSESAEDVASAYETAIARGVSGDEAKAAVSEAIDSMLAEGEITAARDVVSAMSQVIDTSFVQDNMSGLGQSIIEGADNAEEAIRRLEEQSNNILRSSEERTQLAADAALLISAPRVDTLDMDRQVNTFVREWQAKLDTAIANEDWVSVEESAHMLGMDNVDQLVRDLQLRSDFEGIEVPASISFDPTAFDPAMQGFTDQIIGDLQMELDSAIGDAHPENAVRIAEELIGLGHPEAADEVIENYKTYLQNALEKSIGSGDEATAAHTSRLLGFSEFEMAEQVEQAQTAQTDMETAQVGVQLVSTQIVDDVESAEETVTSSIPTFTEAEHTITGAGVEVENVSMRIVDAGIVAADASTEASGEMNIAFGLVAVGSAMLMIATGNYNALASAIQSSAPGMTSQLTQISDALSGFANAGSKALEVSGGLQTVGSTGVGESGSTAGGRGNIGHAEGGNKAAGTGGWIGERGPEWQVVEQDVSILNNQTSEALWTAMQSMGMRGGGGSTTHNTYNINVINNNASGAAHFGATQALANKIRGQ